MRLIVVLVLISSWVNPAMGGEPSDNSGPSSYLFPTNASRNINSGFADYRETHFHGGIDISTNGKIGYPVYAAKSGYVFRVSVSPFGYGKRIILRHDDSTFTLYGHLSAFSREIEQRVEEAQRFEHKYSVDLRFRPGEIRVRRGEVIARTGATGVGGPHLHFEVHDRDYSFVDPLIYKSLDIRDRRTPRVYGIGVTDFKSGEVRMSSVVKHRNGYRVRSVFRMNKPFFFVVHAADSYRRGLYKRPPKHIELKIDGKEYLSLDLTRISAGDYLDVSSLVDLNMSGRYKTYYKLCVDRAIPFSVFTPSVPLSGLIYSNISSGMHNYEIIVGDENGNITRVNGKFVLDMRNGFDGKDPGGERNVLMKPFEGKTITPMPGLTLHFPSNAFVKDIRLYIRSLSATAFVVRANHESLRKKIRLTWKIDNPELQLYRKTHGGWDYVSCANDGKVLTAKIGYELGEFALLRDDTPPEVENILVSRKNPYYRSAAPTHFRRDFVYFRVFDTLSGIDTDDILLKVGSEQFLCEYDADKHAATCGIDDGLLRKERLVRVVVRDNAGNERVVSSRIALR